MRAKVRFRSMVKAAAVCAAIAGAATVAPTAARAVPSVAATPAQDVYTILANNPGLQASLPFYNQAQVSGRFDSLTVVGDSWADWGNALTYNPVSSQVGATGRYGNALNIIDALQYHYALPTSSVSNYAFGGATTGAVNNNPPALMLPGFSQQMQALAASGRRFDASDLITFTTAGVGGANDAAVGIDIAQGTANVLGYMRTLIGLGGKNFLLATPSAAATASLQAALSPLEVGGVHIVFFDFGALIDQIVADPTAYGFAADATRTDYCTRFGGQHVCNEGGINRVRPQTTAEILAEDKYLFFYVHPTTSLASAIAQGETRLLDALPVPEPASLGVFGLGVFGAAMLRRRRRG